MDILREKIKKLLKNGIYYVEHMSMCSTSVVGAKEGWQLVHECRYEGN